MCGEMLQRMPQPPFPSSAYALSDAVATDPERVSARCQRCATKRWPSVAFAGSHELLVRRAHVGPKIKPVAQTRDKASVLARPARAQGVVGVPKGKCRGRAAGLVPAE